MESLLAQFKYTSVLTRMLDYSLAHLLKYTPTEHNANGYMPTRIFFVHCLSY